MSLPGFVELPVILDPKSGDAALNMQVRVTAILLYLADPERPSERTVVRLYENAEAAYVAMAIEDFEEALEDAIDG